jgi:CRISPR system Cascade subunit CasA
MDDHSLNLLDEPMVRIRTQDGTTRKVSLPDLFVCLAHDTVRDYPALRPHQRHPWHALLVQLAALALGESGETKLWTDAKTWRTALLALTPDHPDGCAYSLVSSHDKPAFLQAPVPDCKLDRWKTITTPDALDMLFTSKNHDLKAERMWRSEPDDWLFALTSLQTQDGYPGSGNFGISRMNSGSGSRIGVGLVPEGGPGSRWSRDVEALLNARENIAEAQGLPTRGGVALVWIRPWNGMSSEQLSFDSLHPFYIEICRRIRLQSSGSGRISAMRSTSAASRIEAKSRNGITGDAWTPTEDDKSLTLQGSGFNYKLMAELAWGTKYRPSITQTVLTGDRGRRLALVGRCVVRGQSKTEGYHERRIPLSRKAIGFLFEGKKDIPGTIAAARVKDIGTMRGSVLRTALFYLLEAGGDKIDFDRRTAKAQVEPFLQAFERAEDARFFDDLNREIEAEDPHAERLEWMIGLSRRAEAVLRNAFVIGPQCGERRYRARSRALSFFHGALRSDKHFPLLAHHLHNEPAAKEAAS